MSSVWLILFIFCTMKCCFLFVTSWKFNSISYTNEIFFFPNLIFSNRHKILLGLKAFRIWLSDIRKLKNWTPCIFISIETSFYTEYAQYSHYKSYTVWTLLAYNIMELGCTWHPKHSGLKRRLIFSVKRLCQIYNVYLT